MLKSLGRMFRTGEMFVVLCTLLLACCAAFAIGSDSSYDYSASIECRTEPEDPQYGGGLVSNARFDSGLDEWNVHGNAKLITRTSKSGNNYMVAYDRSAAFDSFSHTFDLQKDVMYTFTAWMQISKGDTVITAMLDTIPEEQHVLVGTVRAQSDCWSMLKGGFTVDRNMKAELFFVSKNNEAELWLDSVSLKPFTKIEWQEHQNKSIDRIRKRKVRLHLTNQDGLKLQGTNITINQTRPHFLVGCGVTEIILDTPAYQDWFVPRFPVATFTNQMKWYFTEVNEGQENYTVPDAMVSFFKKHGIAIRGHNIVWANRNMTQHWVQNLNPRDALKAVVRRIGSVMSRYAGDVIGWDVVNENLHFSYLDEKIEANTSGMIYQIARALDPQTPLFLNEFNVLEFPTDGKVMPHKIVEKIKEIRAFPGNEQMPLSIGLQGHFILKPNVSHVRAVFDILRTTGSPIWLTELDTRRGPDQAEQLEEVMREAFSHPAVEGMIVWGAWRPANCSQECIEDKNYTVLPKGCAEMCLVDNNLKNLAPGDVVDKLLKEWKTTNVTGVTNDEGEFEHDVFLGEYSLGFSHPLIPGTAGLKKFNVTQGNGPLDVYLTL